MLMRNDIAFIEAAYAAMRLGAYGVPVNWHFKPEEINYVLKDSGTRVLIAHADMLHGLREAIPEGVTVLAVPTPPEILGNYKIDPDHLDGGRRRGAAGAGRRTPAGTGSTSSGPGLSRISGTNTRKMQAAAMPMDIYETADNIVVKAAVPGVKPEDIELTAAEQLLSARREVAAVMVTDELSTELLQRALRAGVKDVLAIPVDSVQLVQTVQRVADYQVNTRNLPGITYHYCVAADGQVFQVDEDGEIAFAFGF